MVQMDKNHLRWLLINHASMAACVLVCAAILYVAHKYLYPTSFLISTLCGLVFGGLAVYREKKDERAKELIFFIIRLISGVGGIVSYMVDPTVSIYSPWSILLIFCYFGVIMVTFFLIILMHGWMEKSIG